MRQLLQGMTDQTSEGASVHEVSKTPYWHTIRYMLYKHHLRTHRAVRVGLTVATKQVLVGRVVLDGSVVLHKLSLESWQRRQYKVARITEAAYLLACSTAGRHRGSREMRCWALHQADSDTASIQLQWYTPPKRDCSDSKIVCTLYAADHLS